jgi:hypothetical protein
VFGAGVPVGATTGGFGFGVLGATVAVGSWFGLSLSACAPSVVLSCFSFPRALFRASFFATSAAATVFLAFAFAWALVEIAVRASVCAAYIGARD